LLPEEDSDNQQAGQVIASTRHRVVIKAAKFTVDTPVEMLSRVGKSVKLAIS
jgi:hypothetical protein